MEKIKMSTNTELLILSDYCVISVLFVDIRGWIQSWTFEVGSNSELEPVSLWTFIELHN